MTDLGGLILDVTPNEATLDKNFLGRLGHPVLVCHGPAWGHACPIIKAECPKVESAHGTIFQLDLDRPQHRVILKRYMEIMSNDVPIVAVVKAGQDRRYAELLSDVQVWVDEPSVAELDGFAALVESADELRDAS
jgi:hypothetical protein